MSGDRDADFLAWTDRARAVPLAVVLDMRRLPLRGVAERVGPCPRCGGRDRFGVNVRDNVWRCRGCAPRGGSVIDLVQHIDGCDFLAACETLTGEAPPRGHGRRMTDEERQARADALAAAQARAAARAADTEKRKVRHARETWNAAVPAAGTLVEHYLTVHRGVDLPPDALIRYAPALDFFVDRMVGDRWRAVKVASGPAMVAAVLDPVARLTGAHITWLDPDTASGKLEIADPETGEIAGAKKMRGVVRAGHIPLTQPHAPRGWCMGEGIESTLSVRTALIRQDRDVSKVAFASALSLDGIGGPATQTVPHPTKRILDKNGRELPWMIPGPVPDLAAPAIVLPDSVVSVITLGDGDSDATYTRYAHDRAHARYATPTRRHRAPFAPEGTDFNSLLRGQP